MAECWSDRSKPAADLEFFLDGARVRDERQTELQIIRETDQLESSYRRLSLLARPAHLAAKRIVVKCTARIGEAYWQTSDATITVVSKPSYMLESRSNSNSGQEKDLDKNMFTFFLTKYFRILY